jgi:competence protein ComEC
VKATLDTRLTQSLIQSGTLHIIALSGMNISLLVVVVHGILLRFIRRPIANLATILIIIGFIWFVGVSPSVLRAGLMAALSLLAITVGRHMWPFFAWILAVTSMILLNPPWIGDLSFQLSAMATLGIILFGNSKSASSSLNAPQNGFPRSFLGIVWSMIADDLRVTLAAQVFTIPIILFQFQRISLVSPLSNVLIGWLIAPIMSIGFIMVALGLVWLPLAVPFAWIVWVPLTYSILIIEWTAKLPFASIAW